MNINDFKHPAARQVDEMILAGAPAKEIMTIIYKIALGDSSAFCNACMFVDRLFQFDFIMDCSCSADYCLIALGALAHYMPRETSQELLRNKNTIKRSGGVRDLSFWYEIESCASKPRENVSHSLWAFDYEIDKRIFEDHPRGFDWIFSLIKNRARDGIRMLTKSRWRSRIFQLDVFRAISDDNAWLMLQALPSLRPSIKTTLAKQAFLGTYGESDERVDSLREMLWKQDFLGAEVKDGNWNIALPCRACLDQVVGQVRRESQCPRSPYNLVSWDNPCVDSWATELERFDVEDSVAAMALGESITGLHVQMEDLRRWVCNRKANLFCHYLPRLASDLKPAKVTELVERILQWWSYDAIVKALNVIENLFPSHIRRIHDDDEKNLLILCDEHMDQSNHLSNLLLSLGCDPNERCFAGYTWNDVQRWEGKKCASR